MEDRSMTQKDIARPGKFLVPFLSRFAECFVRPAGRALMQVYVRGHRYGIGHCLRSGERGRDNSQWLVSTKLFGDTCRHC